MWRQVGCVGNVFIHVTRDTRQERFEYLGAMAAVLPAQQTGSWHIAHYLPASKFAALKTPTTTLVLSISIGWDHHQTHNSNTGHINYQYKNG